jgi:hypothetical protein
LSRERAIMDDWYPVRLAPRDGRPVILWIEDPDAPPAYPVMVGVWKPTISPGGAIGASSGRGTAPTPTSTSTLSAGGRCLAFTAPDKKPRNEGVGMAEAFSESAT